MGRWVSKWGLVGMYYLCIIIYIVVESDDDDSCDEDFEDMALNAAIMRRNRLEREEYMEVSMIILEITIVIDQQELRSINTQILSEEDQELLALMVQKGKS